MLTLTLTPPPIAFASAPVIIRATTDLVSQDKRFVRVVLSLSAPSVNHKEDFVCNVPANGEAMFNISDALTTCIKLGESFQVSRAAIHHVVPDLDYSITLTEYYYASGATHTGDSWTGTYKALPGYLSDIERQSMSPNAAEVYSDPIFASRKPVRHDIAVAGLPFVVPAGCYDGTSIVRLSGSGIDLSSEVDGIGEVVFDIPADAEGPCVVTVGQFSKQVYIAQPSRTKRLFVFQNRLGLLETAVAVCNENRVGTINGDPYAVLPDMSFSAVRSFVSNHTEGDDELSMDSGAMSSEWAEWWRREFLPTNHAWIFLDGTFIECAIIADKDITLYDRTKPSAQHIPFTVRLATRGSTSLRWQ